MSISKLYKIAQIYDETVHSYFDGYEHSRDIIVGYIGPYTVRKLYVDSTECAYYMTPTLNQPWRVSDRELVAYLFLYKNDGMHKNTWAVDTLGVSKKHARQNLALQLYKFLAKKQNLVLRIGYAQTAGSRKLWYKLAQEKDVVVFASINKKFIQCDVNHKHKELRVNGLSPYKLYKFHQIDGVYLSEVLA